MFFFFCSPSLIKEAHTWHGQSGLPSEPLGGGLPAQYTCRLNCLDQVPRYGGKARAEEEQTLVVLHGC